MNILPEQHSSDSIEDVKKVTFKPRIETTDGLIIFLGW